MLDISKIKVSKKYKPLFDIAKSREKLKTISESDENFDYWNNLSNVSIVIMTGGRFSVKSFAVSLFQVDLCYSYDYNVMSTRFTNASLKDSVIADMQEKLELLHLKSEFAVQINRIKKKNGSQIIFKGLKANTKTQTANMKSLKNISAWVVEEAEEHPSYKDWETTYLSVRGVDNKQVISVLVLNPAAKHHWVYKKFFEERGVKEGFNGVKDEVLYIHTTYKSCPKEFIPKNILKHFNDMMINEPERYKHIVLGGWLDVAEGVIIKNWEYGKFNNKLPFVYGMDFGFAPDPDVVVKVAVDVRKKIIYVKEIFRGNELGTDDLANILKKKLLLSVPIIADCAEKRLISDLQNRGLRKMQKVVKGKVVEGIKTLKSFKIIVDDSSTKIGFELNNYVAKDGIPVDAFNHSIDAIRYAVEYILDKKYSRLIIGK